MSDVEVEGSVGPRFADIPDSIPIPSIPIETVRVESAGRDVVVDSVPAYAQDTPRRRGRPKGSKNRSKTLLENVGELNTGVKGRLASDVSARGQMVLKAATGVPALWRSYFQMSPEEAQDIADPAASFAVRQAEHSEAVEAFVDNFDIVAVLMGCTKYIVRVIKDDRDFRSEQTPRETMERARVNPQQDRQNQRTVVERQEQANGSSANPNFDNDTQPVSAPFVGDV